MRKSEVQFHRDGGRVSNPAINVKVYNLPMMNEKIVERFKCSTDDAERALQFAFESAQEMFWAGIESTAQSILGSHVRTFSEGRMGGWLTVHNMPPIEDWDAVLLGKWNKLVKLVESQIKELTTFDSMADDIEANRWVEPMSERFNFFRTTTGNDVCVAEINQAVAKYRAGLLAGDIKPERW